MNLVVLREKPMKISKELTYERESLLGDFSRINEMIKESDENLEHLRELSLLAEDKDKYLGNYFSLNVADGRAYYQVQQFNKTADKYLVKRCLGICLDEYADGFLGDGRWVDGEYVRHQVEARKALERLFSK